MWNLYNLINHCNNNKARINGKWVPARPLNYKKGYCSLKERIKNAWLVFTCKAEAFIWPENQ